MNKKFLKVALLQHECNDSRDDNWNRIEQGLRDAQSQGVKLVLLQELHNNLYFCQTENTRFFELAEPIPGPTSDFLAKLARELELVIVASIFERRAAGIYHNTAIVIESDGRLAGRYRKMHIPDDPGYYEKFYFTPGDLGFEPIETSVGKLGVLVCWDQWYPEAARLMALAGADILLYPTAIGWDRNDASDEQQRQRDAWQMIQRAHAIANGLPALSCNRVGRESAEDGSGEIEFWGTSFAAGPQGEILAQASGNEAELLVVSLDLQRSEAVRQIWPYFRDRRIDAYDEILLRYRDNTEDNA